MVAGHVLPGDCDACCETQPIQDTTFKKGNLSEAGGIWPFLRLLKGKMETKCNMTVFQKMQRIESISAETSSKHLHLHPERCDTHSRSH